MRYENVDPSRVTVIHEAADVRFSRPMTDLDRAKARSLVGFDEPYLFYVGGWESRKNLPFLIEGFAQASVTGLRLLLAGGKDLERERMNATIRSLDVLEKVKLLSYVPDADLPALYADALGFVHPSRYEGFGLQLCEAMATGCPVLAADATSLPEVLGDGGVTFPLDSPEGLARAIRRLADDPGHRRSLIDRALARSKAFSWPETARRTAEVYRGAMGPS